LAVFDRLQATGLSPTEVKAIKNTAASAKSNYLSPRMFFMACEYERMAQNDNRPPPPEQRPLFNERDEIEAGIEFQLGETK
jgi:hypothetical protein